MNPIEPTDQTHERQLRWNSRVKFVIFSNKENVSRYKILNKYDKNATFPKIISFYLILIHLILILSILFHKISILL